jgi:hypothetical protein
VQGGPGGPGVNISINLAGITTEPSGGQAMSKVGNALNSPVGKAVEANLKENIFKKMVSRFDGLRGYSLDNVSTAFLAVSLGILLFL